MRSACPPGALVPGGHPPSPLTWGAWHAWAAFRGQDRGANERREESGPKPSLGRHQPTCLPAPSSPLPAALNSGLAARRRLCKHAASAAASWFCLGAWGRVHAPRLGGDPPTAPPQRPK